MSHTPGPWKTEGWKGLIVNSKVGTIVAMPGASNRAPLEEHQANARLIAAAPELLAACERALSWLPAFVDTCDGHMTKSN